MNLTELGATQLATAIAQGEVSASEVVEAHLERIALLGRLNAVVTVDADGARAKAKACDQRRARGEALGPLGGVPFTLKDMHATKGVRSTCGLVPLKDNVPDEDGIAAHRLAQAGGILLGKTNMAMNIESDGDLFGRPLNPWDETRSTGGSSGGAAAALAARLTPLEVGTDMSGSIRMPAHFCGVFGLKPTIHRIPGVGIIDPWRLRQNTGTRLDRWYGVSGPMARNVADLQLAFRVLAGPDPRDTEVPPVAVREPTSRRVEDLRIAYASQIPPIPSSARQRAVIEALVQKLRDAGAVVDECPLPFPFEELLGGFRHVMRVILQATVGIGGAPPGLAALAGDPLSVKEVLDGFGERDRLIRAYEGLVSKYDAFITPAALDATFVHRPRGEPISVDGATVSSQVVDHPCVLATYTGCPAVIVPAALVDGLPVGVQLHGRRWHDEALLDVAAVVAQVAGELPAPRIDLA